MQRVSDMKPSDRPIVKHDVSQPEQPQPPINDENADKNKLPLSDTMHGRTDDLKSKAEDMTDKGESVNHNHEEMEKFAQAAIDDIKMKTDERMDQIHHSIETASSHLEPQDLNLKNHASSDPAPRDHSLEAAIDHKNNPEQHKFGIVDDLKNTALNIKSSLMSDAKDLKSEAQHLKSEAITEAEKLKSQAMLEGDKLKSSAMSEADKLKLSASSHASQWKSQASYEADKLKSSASSGADKLKYEADKMKSSAASELDHLKSGVENLKDKAMSEVDKLKSSLSSEADDLKSKAKLKALDMKLGAENLKEKIIPTHHQHAEFPTETAVYIDRHSDSVIPEISTRSSASEIPASPSHKAPHMTGLFGGIMDSISGAVATVSHALHLDGPNPSMPSISQIENKASELESSVSHSMHSMLPSSSSSSSTTAPSHYDFPTEVAVFLNQNDDVATSMVGHEAITEKPTEIVDTHPTTNLYEVREVDSPSTLHALHSEVPSDVPVSSGLLSGLGTKLHDLMNAPSSHKEFPSEIAILSEHNNIDAADESMSTRSA